MPTDKSICLPYRFSPQPARALTLLARCPSYRPSPLRKRIMADGHSIWIKDESQRMGLGSFKALGGVYAVAILISEHWYSQTGALLRDDEWLSASVKNFASGLSFVCASAGNHGLAVAAGAQLFGARARIHLSNHVPERFALLLRSKNADVIRSGNTYEESLICAQQDADASGATLLADGSWPGYFHAPALVMEGYCVIAEELRAQFERDQGWPSHVYLQAGVGGLAAAITHMIRHTWASQPQIVVVEPDKASCLSASYEAGKLINAVGGVSNMGRLDCKQASLIAHDVLAHSQVSFAVVNDQQAAQSVSDLAGLGVHTSPSGAAGFAALDASAQRHFSNGDETQYCPLVIVTEGPV